MLKICVSILCPNRQNYAFMHYLIISTEPQPLQYLVDNKCNLCITGSSCAAQSLMRRSTLSLKRLSSDEGYDWQVSRLISIFAALT